MRRTCQFVIVRDYNTIEKNLPEVKENLPEIKTTCQANLFRCEGNLPDIYVVRLELSLLAV